MSDESQTQSTAVVNVNPLEAPSGDMTSYLIKMGVAVILGPKLSPYLKAWGIPIDPVMMSVVVGGVLHKAHEIVKDQTGWKWL